MSVAALTSPASRCKRLYEAGDVDLGYEGASLDNRQQKRTRLQRHSPGRCGLHYQSADEPAHANALSGLLALFPGMDEKVVQDVLVECGNSIDAAIKRLTDLRLSTEDATVAAAKAAASARDHGQQSTTTAGSASQPLPQAPEAASTSCASPGEPQTADQWIEFLVAEMLASKDMGDARGRAAHVLQHFERFVKQRQKDEADARVAELLKESAIFKRAVQIQDTRMKGAAEEMSQLRTMLVHYQERCSKLEMNNYSLAMHLQQATNSSSLGSHPHNPDVC